MTRQQAASSNIMKVPRKAARNSWQKHGGTQRTPNSPEFPWRNVAQRMRVVCWVDLKMAVWEYQVEDLVLLYMQAVQYGGLRDLNIHAGDTIIITPAMGIFSGAAVQLAVAKGARV